ncbi:hypothetical protein PoB_005898700 [Plakobranchus ocellatus]|uniref:Uncharacterized protein n=1 Tax=Plakobranchus ocellatus TaxID=259542 RepID=A0AAV4CLG8_9GAST|nr:hypothetical protein PoB_005898700 [Plakobranchus ocellatus]
MCSQAFQPSFGPERQRGLCRSQGGFAIHSATNAPVVVAVTSGCRFSAPKVCSFTTNSIIYKEFFIFRLTIYAITYGEIPIMPVTFSASSCMRTAVVPIAVDTFTLRGIPKMPGIINVIKNRVFPVKPMIEMFEKAVIDP